MPTIPTSESDSTVATINNFLTCKDKSMIKRSQCVHLAIALIFSWQGPAFAAPPVDLNSKVASGTTAYSGPPPSSNTVHQYPSGTALQKKSQLEASYYNKAGEVVSNHDSQQAGSTSVYVFTPRSFSSGGQTIGPTYQVETPNGDTIDVTSSRPEYGEAQKNIAVYAPGSSVSSEAVVIDVPHADVKAAIAYKDGQGINSQNAEAAKNVAVERGNVVKTTESRDYVTP